MKHAGNIFAILTAIGFGLFVAYCNQPTDTGYTISQRTQFDNLIASEQYYARKDDIIANITPLHIADLEMGDE